MPSPSLGFGLLVTTLVALGPLSTDLYLPSLPALAEAFSTDAASVQLTLSVFLAGFGVSQLLYGPLSDRFGRRPVLLGGLAIYLASSVACAAAQSIEALIGARLLQSIGACAGPVLGRAIVRDVYGAIDAARILAYVSGAMAIAPMVGPLFGGYLTVWFGWQANFALLAAFSAIQIIAVALMLAETNAHPDAEATQPARVARNFAALMASPQYLGYLLCFSAGYAGLFSFISGSSFVLMNVMGLSPQAYGASFGFAVAGYITGALFSGKLAARAGPRRLVFAGALIAVASGTAMAVLAWASVASVWAVLLPMFVSMVGKGLIMPNAIAGALAPFPRMAGSASALMGFVQMSLAALVGIAVGHGFDGTARPMALAIAVCAWAILGSYLLILRRVA